MKVLSCAEARDLACDLIDGELAEADVENLESHVAGCSTCPALYRSLIAVTSALFRGRQDDTTVA